MPIVHGYNIPADAIEAKEERKQLDAIKRRIAELEVALDVPKPRKQPFVTHPLEEEAKRAREAEKRGDKTWQKAKSLPRSRRPVTSEEIAVSPINAMSVPSTKYRVISPGLQSQAASPTPSLPPVSSMSEYSSTSTSSPVRFRGVATETSKLPWKMPKVDKDKVKDPYLRAQGLHRNNLMLYSDVAKNLVDKANFAERPSVDFDFKYTDFNV